jgi:hypothetical protein
MLGAGQMIPAVDRPSTPNLKVLLATTSGSRGRALWICQKTDDDPRRRRVAASVAMSQEVKWVWKMV